VHLAAELALRRAGDGDRLHACRLRGDHIHDHGTGIDRKTARHIQADAVHGDPSLAHLCAGSQIHRSARGNRRLVEGADAVDRLLERLPDRRIQASQSVGQCLIRDTQGRGRHAIEALAVLEHGLGTARADVGKDGGDGREGVCDVDLGARHEVAQLPGRQVATADIDSTQHADQPTGAAR